MCMICERIRAIKNGTNPYFVQELETGYVVLGDHQHLSLIHIYNRRVGPCKAEGHARRWRQGGLAP